MKCSKCGAELNKVEMAIINPTTWVSVDFVELPGEMGIEFVTAEIPDYKWEDRNNPYKSIRCPYCKDHPFELVSIFEAARVVCYKGE